MKEIQFKKDGEPLRVSFIFIGAMYASYTFYLFNANSNSYAQDPNPGNNQNPQDDIYYLPMPSSLNDNRIIELTTSLVGDGTSTNYRVIMEVYQGNKLLESIVDENNLLNNKPVDSYIFCKLKSIYLNESK